MQDLKRKVYIVDGARTPFVRARGKPNPLSAADLAVAAAKPLLERQSFEPQDLDQVIAGCVAPAPDEVNIARIIALRLGCGDQVPGWTVQRNCASGMQALDSASVEIQSGRSNLILAGGTECMSRAPLLYPVSMTEWLSELQGARTFSQKLKALLHFRLKHLKPIISLLKALTDPVVNLSMGQTAEKLADQFSISREEMDAYSVQSHRRAALAIEKELLKEVIPLFDWEGSVLSADNGVRADSSEDKLAKLKPVFEKPFGKVTAGNSSQITDGAAFLLLASEEAVNRYNLSPLAEIKDTAWAALDPSVMGLGPVYATHKILKANELDSSAVDFWEINEAFAGQLLACLKAMDDQQWCQHYLNEDKPLGAIPMEKLNLNGGAIAIGHPVGATGARLVLHLLHTLEEHQAKRGIASLCIGGGQGGAMLIERTGGVHG